MLCKTVIALVGASLWLQTAAQCHNYVLINIRGTLEPQQRSIAFIDMTNNTLAKLPGGIEYDLVYPANAQANSSAIGFTNLVNYINNGTKACPDQKYAILGYSQGASVATLALSKFNNPRSAQFKAIASVLLVGNPGHKPYQSANYDENGGLTTVGYLGSYYSSGLRVPNSWYKSTKVIDICFDGDVVCAPASPNASFAGHIKYGYTASVQTIGTQWLIGTLTPESALAITF